eukprot:151424_1
MQTTLRGNYDDIIRTGHCQSLRMNGECDDIKMRGNNNSLRMGGTCDDVQIIGNANEIRIYGSSDNVLIHGDGNNIRIYGANDKIKVYGNRNYVRIYGTNERVHFHGTQNNIRVYGINGRVTYHRPHSNHNNSHNTSINVQGTGNTHINQQRNDANMDDSKENIENINPDIARLPIAICKCNPSVSAKAECLICMDRFEKGAKIMTLPCFHRFHAKCVTQWFKTNQICPKCRHSIRKIHHQ